jgi:hypothetical protein
MAVIALDPDRVDSALPPGGKPSWDDAFLEWARGFVLEVNLAALLINHPDWFGTDLRAALSRRCEGLALAIKPAPLNVWQLTGHLYKHLHGNRPAPALNYAHRLRFIAIQFQYRRAELLAEASAYAEIKALELYGVEAASEGGPADPSPTSTPFSS